MRPNHRRPSVRFLLLSRSSHARLVPLLALSCLCVCLTVPAPVLQAQEIPASTATGGEALELTDLMKLRQIEDAAISDDGAWIWYALVPDRGDGEAVARRTDAAKAAEGAEDVAFRIEGGFRIQRGTDPAVSDDGRWFAARVQAPLAERLAAEAEEGGDPPETDLELVALEMASLPGEARTGGRTSFERVKKFAFSADGAWLARQHFAEEKEKEEKKERGEKREKAGESGEAGTEKEKKAQLGRNEVEGEAEEAGHEEELGTSLVLRRLADGSEIEIQHVDSWAFDATGAWLAYTVVAPGGEGNGLFLRALGEEGAPQRMVRQEAGGRYAQLTWTEEEVTPPRLAFVAGLREEEGTGEGDAAGEMVGAAGEVPGDEEPGEGEAEDGGGADPVAAEVWLWDGAEGRAGRLVGPGSQVLAAADGGEGNEDGTEEDGGWFVPFDNELTFSRDGGRLFFGRKPAEERAWIDPEAEGEGGSGNENGAGGEAGDIEAGDIEAGDIEAQDVDPYDLEEILEERTVTVWHGDDPLIQPNQKESWEEIGKRTYTAVVHLGERPLEGELQVVPLADRQVREVERSDNPRAALGADREPYFRQRTWEGFFADFWWVDLVDGSRQLIARRLERAPELSPGGRYAVFWQAPHWYLFDSRDGSVRNLTEGLPVPFADEDHDYPSPPPGYGVAGWLEEDAAVLIYDKYDLWQIPTATDATGNAGQEPFRWTGGDGRERRVRYRLVDLEPERPLPGPLALAPGEGVLLSEYDEGEKSHGFARARAGRRGVETLLHEAKKFDVVAKAEDSDTLLYTRESYREFPDLWVADLGVADPGVTKPGSDQTLELADRRKLSRANPDLDRYAWGTAELVRWESADGVPLDGVLIKPGDYREGERYPVLVYFYRFFSQRLHEFNEPVVNHRPSFPFYASHGYAVFLPDVRFEVGRPGLSAVKALVPGVQKLVEMGVADPGSIGLHGHSWSGYQAAFVVTQTDLFAATVAGAPVSNMTSAYGGIRYGTGLARQFQYEQSQSRIGGSLWEARPLYIENSPVFYADRIDTPMLIQFGDEDEAVPWTQGIELYLALRRLDKEVVFLQYEGEPHHLKQYANKLDYSLKMKEFFDHHLKGEPAPEWMSEGVPYRGQ